MNKNKEVFEFLDNLSTINHNEPEAKLLRTNFGFSREHARYMVWAWKEERDAIEAKVREIARQVGFEVEFVQLEEK